ncbi:hypothetical protein D1872_256490 [compost metagenome]
MADGRQSLTVFGFLFCRSGTAHMSFFVRREKSSISGWKSSEPHGFIRVLTAILTMMSQHPNGLQESMVD